MNIEVTDYSIVMKVISEMTDRETAHESADSLLIIMLKEIANKLDQQSKDKILNAITIYDNMEMWYA